MSRSKSLIQLPWRPESESEKLERTYDCPVMEIHDIFIPDYFNSSPR